MACYTVQLQSVEFTVGSREILEAAVKQLGWTITGNIIQTPDGRIFLSPGKISCENALMPLVNMLRQKYARACAKEACKQAGWQMTAQNEKQLKFNISRGI